MSPTKSQGISNEKFGVWLRREFWRSLRLGAGFGIVGAILIVALNALSPAFAAQWTLFNYQLSSVALDQHPLALARTFGSHLRESEYGWRPLSLSAPFNVTAARQRLRQDYPEVSTVRDGQPVVPRASRLKAANATQHTERMADYMRRHQAIEAGRFAGLYNRDDVFTPPNANVKLGLFITKIFGLPDALFFTFASIIHAGLASVVLFAIVLSLAAVALWRSRRPARTVLKLVVWPTLASTLVWAAILIMAFSSALFGGLTVNTSALPLFAAIPFLFLLAKIPLHLAESLVLAPAPAPAKWDGIERRKPRPAPPADDPAAGI